MYVLISSQKPYHFLLSHTKVTLGLCYLLHFTEKAIMVQGAGIAQLSGSSQKNIPGLLTVNLAHLPPHCFCCSLVLCLIPLCNHGYEARRLQNRILVKDEYDSRTTRLVSDIPSAALGPTTWDSLIRNSVLAMEEMDLIGLMELKLEILAIKR